MEHVVQFGISIDDKMIQDRVLDKAERNITEAIKKDFEKAVFGERSYYSSRDQLSPWMEVKLKAFLAENKDGILEKAAAALAEKMARMKVVKEKVAEIIGEA